MPSICEEKDRLLWPALIILKRGRHKEASDSILARIKAYQRPRRLLSGDEVPLDLLKSPAATQDVLNWLYGVWRTLESARSSELSIRRRSMMQAVLRSNLSHEDQSGLFTAVDYLFRLSTARRIAQKASGQGKVTVPATQSPHMQSAYRRVLELAATDLPLWLAGEKGTELERIARLVHGVRGFPETTFHELKLSQVAHEDRVSWGYFKEAIPSGPDVTVFLAGIDEAPVGFQEILYQQMVMEMGHAQTMQTILTSVPLDPQENLGKHIFPDLFVFLSPTMVEIPPLRKRIQDLDGLISLFAVTRNLENPISRFDPAVLEFFRQYHWPGNTEELERIVAFVLKKRPSGNIRVEDLPQTVRPCDTERDKLLEILEDIAAQENFRILRNEEGRRRVACFLAEQGSKKFGAGDIQRVLSLGRETARRLLIALESRGLIEGLKGAGEQRITRYRRRV